MSNLSTDITRLREAGRSDEEILAGLEKFSPQYAPDIGRLRATNRAPAEILDGVQRFEAQAAERGPWLDYGQADHTPLARPGRAPEPALGPWTEYEQSSPPDAGVVGNVASVVDAATAPLRYGASEAARGYAQTLRETGNDGLAAQTLGSTSKMLAPEGYKPAHVTINPRTWGEIPKALGEAIPSIAPDVAAGSLGATAGAAAGSVVPGIGTAVGGIVGGLAGGITSYAMRNYGNDLRGAAIANGGTATSEPTNSDKVRALLASGVGGVASRLGFKAGVGVPMRAADGSVGSQLLSQGAKAAAANVGLGVAAEGAHQGLIDQKLDGERLGGSLVTGAATGIGLRALSSVKDANAERRFGDITPVEAAGVARRLQAVHGAEYRGTAKQDFQAVDKVSSDLAVHASALASDAAVHQQIRSLRQSNPEDSTGETLSRVQRDIASERIPTPADMESLTSGLGALPRGAALVEALRDQSVLNRIKALGNHDTGSQKFSGGAASSPVIQALTNPTHHIAALSNLGAAGSAISGAVSGHLALGVPLAQAGLYGGLRAVDAFTGARSPTQAFINRFGGDAPDQVSPAAPARDAVSIARQETSAAQTLADYEARKFTPSVPPEGSNGVSAVQAARQQATASRVLSEREPSAPQPGTHPAAPNAQDVGITSPRVSTEAGPSAAIQKLLAALAASEKVTAFRRPSDAPTARIPDAPDTPPPPVAPAVTPPATFDIVAKSGTRQQLVEDVRSKRSNVQNGVDTRDGARRDILEVAPKNLPEVSPLGAGMLSANWSRISAEVFNINRRADAREHMEGFLKYLPPADAQAIRNYLSHHVDPSTGMTFYDTWGG